MQHDRNLAAREREAIVLMRRALALLEGAESAIAVHHLELAIESVRRARRRLPPRG